MSSLEILVLTILNSVNTAVIIWLCIDRDRLHKRVDTLYRYMESMK